MEKRIVEDTDIIFLCPICASETPHRILKGQFPSSGGSFTATIKCEECGYVHKEEINIPKNVELRMIVSSEGESRRSKITFPEDELLRTGEEIYHDEHTLMIKSIELNDGRRVDMAPASQIMTLWAVQFDQVPVKISINRGEKTTSHKIYAYPDELFYVDDIINIGRARGVVNYIKTPGGIVRRGSVKAKDVVRIYAKIIKERHKRGCSAFK